MAASGALAELFEHQAWADAEHWRAVARQAAASADEVTRRRLYHVQAVERAFLGVWRGAPFRPEPYESYAGWDDLRQPVLRYHREVAEFLSSLDPARVEETVSVPWFPQPKAPLTLGRTMQQVVMHSHYHRGQNAARLRELGAVPPLTDFIVWLARGCPAPVWSDPG